MAKWLPSLTSGFSFQNCIVVMLLYMCQLNELSNRLKKNRNTAAQCSHNVKFQLLSLWKSLIHHCHVISKGSKIQTQSLDFSSIIFQTFKKNLKMLNLTCSRANRHIYFLYSIQDFMLLLFPVPIKVESINPVISRGEETY